ncbi:MAG: DUF4397 domain-containing protein [Chitinophagaceae bacterium]
MINNITSSPYINFLYSNKKLTLVNLLRLSICLVLICTASSCLKNEDNTPEGPKARLSVSNYVVNAGGFQVMIDDNQVSTNELQFGTTTNNGGNTYLQVAAGLHNIKLSTANGIIGDYTIALKSNTNYSLFVYDSLKSSGVKALLAEDEQPTDTVAKARFLHVVPGDDSLTAVIIKGTVGVALVRTYLGKQPDPEINSAFDLVLDPSFYRVQLRKNNMILFRLDSVLVQAGKQYSFVAAGTSGGTGVYRERIIVIEHD